MARVPLEWRATACRVILSRSEESHTLGNEILRSTLRMTMGANWMAQ